MANKTLAFEIGTEELPAFDLHAATQKLEGLASGALDGAGIPHGEIAVYSTPRRLIIVVDEVPEKTEARSEAFRGPSVKIAFDEAGNPTRAASGFARGKGVDVSALERRCEGDTEYVYAVIDTPERDVAALLPELLGNVIVSIPWPKTQRWGSRDEQFSRPVRWLYAQLGTEIIPVTFAGLCATDETYGHRFLAPGPHKIACADKLIEVLRASFVVPSEAEREKSIREQVACIEKESGLKADLHAKTLQEVINLTEYPTVMVGEFDELFLAVPKEITVDAMLVHQRYFPLFSESGALTNKFLITSNGDAKFASNIIDGNQRVVAARLYDAKFFFDEDLRQPLEAFVEGLDKVVFQESLGTTLEKTKRIVKLARHFASAAGLNETDARDAARAAYLCKADLVSGAVVEFTSVQGIMGSYYAAASGETPQVAQAIADHYRPRFSGDDLPATDVGKVVALADKLDTICGLFAVGQAPTGSSDPFALRRSAIGIVSILPFFAHLSLLDAIDASLDAYTADGIEFDREKTRAEVIDFFITRTKVMLRDEGVAPDVLEAVLAVGVFEPMELIRRARALSSARTNEPETFDDLATAYARANNLRDASCGADFDESKFIEIERALASAIAQAESQVNAALERDDYATALTKLAAMRSPIDEFFANIMVMDEDLALRENRMKLLNAFVAVFANVADFGAMAKK